MKNKWPTGGTRYKVPLYGGTIWLFTNRIQWNKAAKFLNALEADSDSLGVSLMATRKLKVGEDRIYLIGVFDRRLQTLVHEIAHTAFSICKEACFEPDAANNEPYCYLIDDLFGHLQEGLRR